MIEDLFVDLIEYRISGGVHLAVDMHGNDICRMGLYLLEELEKSCGLARTGWPQAEGIDGTGALQSRTDAEFEAVHLIFPVQEVLGQMI